MTAADHAEKANKAKEGRLSSLCSLSSHRIALEVAEARTLLAIARRAVRVDADELDLITRLAVLVLSAEAGR